MPSISRKNDWNQKIFFTRAETIPLVPAVDSQKTKLEYKKRDDQFRDTHKKAPPADLEDSSCS